MSFFILTNTARERAALLQATDSSDVATDATGIKNVSGGPRHLSWTQSGTGERRIAYINKTNKFTVDTFIMTRADRHVGHEFKLRSWSAYPGTSTDHVNSSNWAPTLVGVGSNDFVQTGLTITAAEAVGIVLAAGTAGAYTKTVSQLFFGTAFNLPEPRSVSVQMQWQTVTLGRKSYLLRERRSFTLENISRAEVETLQALPNDEPLFFYDSTGIVFADKLYHCLLTDVAIQPAQNDNHNVSIEISQLRHYAETAL